MWQIQTMEYNAAVRSKGPKKYIVTWIDFENNTRWKKARNRMSPMHNTIFVNYKKKAHRTPAEGCMWAYYWKGC